MKFEIKPLTVEEIRAHRELHGSSMMEAKRVLWRDRLTSALADLRANGTLEDKIDFLLDRFEESLKR